MQQRRPRLGDILDDYCPRERRITNHAVVAMIEDEVKQTRCTTCDAEHEYKQGKVPVSRRKKIEHPAAGDLLAAAASLARMPNASADEPPDSFSDPLAEGATAMAGAEGDDLVSDATSEPLSDDALAASDARSADGSDDGSEDVSEDASEDTSEDPSEDEGPVHRRLIRATLPRPEGQAPERKEPDFTMRNTNGRFDQRNGQRHRGRQQARQGGQTFGQPARQGGQRQGAGRPGGGQDAGSRQRNGNQPGNAAGQRGGRPFGANRGSRPGGGGQGRKRGR
jgi:hypothetical protein